MDVVYVFLRRKFVLMHFSSCVSHFNYASNCADFLKALNFSCVSPNDNKIVEWYKFRVVNCYAITIPKML